MRSLISSIVVICLALEAHALIPAKLLLPHGVSGAHRRSGRSSGIPAFPAPMKMVMDEVRWRKGRVPDFSALASRLCIFFICRPSILKNSLHLVSPVKKHCQGF